ncbi:uncharacterized protein LOC126894817 isoform X2 [Daktulosphaira vitifoliae]|uniref:uncharacterized protein LOC126894817 isoform X2 n=2 Tax=Daktulosphaira vitifoliae TaxID=58002 RepID=UPI0021A981F0|nr:uncharacterized protein LOC126894817 isoform X2 [Daktulosphaira vitifoliae]
MPLLVTQNINEHNFICIIDDAEQCIEPLTLLPILFGINRLILVGNDSLVKPIVKNQISKDNDLNISLIRRLNLWLKKSKNVEDNSSNISRITLDRQYRTHSSICSFPSTFFYGRTIKNTTSTFENYPLQRYLLLNHKFIHDNVEDINMNEAVLIQNLIHIIVSNVQNKIIKIALSNENQYKIIKGLIKNN